MNLLISKAGVYFALITLTACSKPYDGRKEIAQAETILKSQREGSALLRTAAFTPSSVCGTMRDFSDGIERDFYVELSKKKLAVAGDNDFATDEYQRICNRKLSIEDVQRMEQRRLAMREIEGARRKKEAGFNAARRWHRENDESIKALHDAVLLLQH